MEIIFLLIGISVVFIIVIARLFFWAVKSGQYDDLEGPRHQILMDDDDAPRSGQGEDEKARQGD